MITKESKDLPECPHCGAQMKKLLLPSEAAYECEYMLACFNDDCPYYIQGWHWMWERFEVRSSYRHRINPITGGSSPLPVWSPTALKNRILL
jgi:hypothetical protein